VGPARYVAVRGWGAVARTTHEDEAAEQVLDMCTRRGIAFMPFFPLIAIGAHLRHSDVGRLERIGPVD
jgi:hypothetical protein